VTVSSSQSAKSWGGLFLAHGGYPLLMVCAFLMDMRRVIAIAVAHGAAGGVNGVLDQLNFLVFAQWFCLFEIARRVDWSGVHAKNWERVAGLGLALYAGFFVNLQSHYLTAILGVWIAIKLGMTSRELWILAIPLAWVSVQDVPGKEIAGYSIGALMVPVDVFGAHSILAILGYPVKPFHENLLRIAGTLHGVSVIPTCSSAGPLFEALAGFTVFAAWLGAKPNKRTILMGLAVAASVFLVNWLRLALTALSRESYEFWHNGDGKAVIALTYLALMFVFAEFAAGGKSKSASTIVRAPKLSG
jgi:exosortase/archaeosortase family protein